MIFRNLILCLAALIAVGLGGCTADLGPAVDTFVGVADFGAGRVEAAPAADLQDRAAVAGMISNETIPAIERRQNFFDLESGEFVGDMVIFKHEGSCYKVAWMDRSRVSDERSEPTLRFWEGEDCTFFSPMEPERGLQVALEYRRHAEGK